MTLRQLINSLRSIEPNTLLKASYVAAKLEALDDLNTVKPRKQPVARHPRQTAAEIEKKVVAMLDSGESQAKTASYFGLSPSTVSKIQERYSE